MTIDRGFTIYWGFTIYFKMIGISNYPILSHLLLGSCEVMA